MLYKRYLAVMLVPLVAAACDSAGGDPAGALLGTPSTEFAKAAPTVCETITFDDFNPALASALVINSYDGRRVRVQWSYEEDCYNPDEAPVVERRRIAGAPAAPPTPARSNPATTVW